MQKPIRIFSAVALAAAVLTTGMSAQAQTSSSGSSMSSSSGSSWYMPSQAYIGLNAGRSNFRQGCGTGLFSCGDKDDAFTIYGGSMFNNNFGVELAYLDMGNIDRGGGTTEARGINFSLVGRVPLSQTFNVFGKIGTTYGSTKVTSRAGSGITTGDEDGFGLSLGAGISYDFTPNWSAVLQWDRHNFDFAGSGREPVHATTIGVKYRF